MNLIRILYFFIYLNILPLIILFRNGIADLQCIKDIDGVENDFYKFLEKLGEELTFKEINELSGDILQNIKENQDNANELCKEIALKCFSLRSRWCLSIIAGEIDFYERGSTEADTAWGVIFKLYFRKVALLRCMVETRFATYNFYVTTYSVTKYPLYVFVGQNMNFDCTANLYAVVPIPANPSNLN